MLATDTACEELPTTGTRNQLNLGKIRMEFPQLDWFCKLAKHHVIFHTTTHKARYANRIYLLNAGML